MDGLSLSSPLGFIDFLQEEGEEVLSCGQLCGLLSRKLSQFAHVLDILSSAKLYDSAYDGSG